MEGRRRRLEGRRGLEGRSGVGREVVFSINPPNI